MQKIKSLRELSGVMTELPRGGYLLETSAGYIQFGSPPETLKDTIFLPLGVPSVFILPIQHFDPAQGMSVAEIEFPIYYNFFIKKRKTRIFVNPGHIENMKTVLQEAVFGPEHIDLSLEVEMTEGAVIPDLAREMSYFRAGRELSDMVELLPLNPAGFDIGEVQVLQNADGSFEVTDAGKKLCTVPGKISFKALYDLGTTLSEPFIPPEYGITCLGPSHGFDPEQNTSGFILWINKVGIMVDPPANSTLWLKDSNVNPKLIDGVILTHCHADHDAGTFQKILEENRITIYTTPTIMESFLRKYSALTRIPAENLMNLFDFFPIRMNSPVNIHGALFKFFYTLHSIPTIGFHFSYRNKTFLYSSDHLNEPTLIRKLYEDGVIGKERMDYLLKFPWNTDMIYHEAGIPPLHTPVSYLNSLPEDVQKRITVYHIAEKDFPKETHLRLAKFGIGETVYPDIEKHRYEDSYRILDVFSRIEVFQDLPFDKIKDLLLVVKEEHFKKGELIIQKNTPGDKFYVIVSGNVSVSGLANTEIQDKVYTTFEYFGEVSILLGTPRTADVIALTSVDAYSIDRESFIRLIAGSPTEDRIRLLASTRDENTWTVIRANRFFKKLSSFQITQLEGMMKAVTLEDDKVLFKHGAKQDKVYLLAEGVAASFRGDKLAATYSRGDMIGDIAAIRKGRAGKCTCKARKGTKLYQIDAKDMIRFLEKNPGVLMNWMFANKSE